MKNVRTVGIKYLLFGNNSASNNKIVRGGAGASRVINLRRSPFFFQTPLRVISNITGEGTTFCQLLFYESNGLRNNF